MCVIHFIIHRDSHLHDWLLIWCCIAVSFVCLFVWIVSLPLFTCSTWTINFFSLPNLYHLQSYMLVLFFFFLHICEFHFIIHPNLYLSEWLGTLHHWFFSFIHLLFKLTANHDSLHFPLWKTHKQTNKEGNRGCSD